MDQIIQDLQQQVTVLEATIVEKDKLIAAQAEKIDTLELALLTTTGTEPEKKVEKVKPTIPEQPVEVDGKKYKWKLAAFVFEFQKYTAEEASTDTKLLKRIIKATGNSVLQELV